ncbi:MAG: helix-turn-helix domain-containing protein [Anaerolineae bacterium]
MNQEDELTPIWKALSDPTRRTILDLLKERPRTTGELCDAFEDLSRFAVMKHLGVLEDAELVFVRPHGRERWNHLNVVPLQTIYERWLRPYEARWASALLNLKQLIEEKGEKPMTNQPNDQVLLRNMQVEQEVSINASAERVFEALTADVAAWWGAPYLLTASPQAIILEPQVGGRLYEQSSSGDGALWATVTTIRKNEHLELTGPIGMSGALHSVVTFNLEPKNEGEATLLKLSHHAIGQLGDDTQSNYNAGWQELLGVRLKTFVEKGERLGLSKGIIS